MEAEQAKALLELDDSLFASARWLLQEQGPLKARAQLERTLSPAVARALLDSVDCQLRFADKFAQAERWLLTREAAEQATRSDIACWRSSYLRSRLPHLTRVTEIGTGIGGDSVFLARHFELDGTEKSAARAVLAEANLRRLSPQTGSHVIRSGQAQPSELSGELLFVDPSRREGGRKFDPEDWEPPLSSLLHLPSFQAVCVKAAPGILTDAVPSAFEMHFISHQGELKEAMLLRTSHPSAPRHAWLFAKESADPLHLAGVVSLAAVRDPQVGQYLLAPDPALVRSGLLASWAANLDAGLVHPKIAYLSSSAPSPDAWAQSFRILEVGKLHWKRLSQSLLDSGWGDFEYLSRGVPFSQSEVLTRLKKAKKKMSGPRRGSLIIYRHEGNYQMVLADRQGPPQEASRSG